MNLFRRPSVSRSAFTLLEVVVTMGIFSIISLVIVDIFLNSSREERRTFGRQNIQANTRTILETIARDIRLGTIDYSFYAAKPLEDGGLPKPVKSVGLIMPDGSKVYYHCVYPNLTWNGFPVPNQACEAVDTLRTSGVVVTGDAEIRISSGQQISDAPILAAEGVRILDFSVLIQPASNPFGSNPAVFQQPRVTMSITSVGQGRDVDTFKSLIQTTVTSRRYAP